MVAGDRSPSNVPVIASFVPVNTAEMDPVPAMVACMATSIGTGDNLALNVFGDCAETPPALSVAASANERTEGTRIGPLLLLGFGHHNARVASFAISFWDCRAEAARFAASGARIGCRRDRVCIWRPRQIPRFHRDQRRRPPRRTLAGSRVRRR